MMKVKFVNPVRNYEKIKAEIDAAYFEVMSKGDLIDRGQLKNFEENLAKEGIDAECIDLRSVKPIDKDIILQSVHKTGRLVIADVGWQSFGFSAEIAAMVAQHGFQFLKAPVLRVALPDCPAPASKTLEEAYYPTAIDIAYTVQKVLSFS